MSRVEVSIGTDSALINAELAEIDRLPPLDKLAATGALLVHIGVLWQTKAAEARGRDRAFDHNRRGRRAQ